MSGKAQAQLEEEIWAPYEGTIYEVSNLGKIRNKTTGKELKLRADLRGYIRCSTYKGTPPKMCSEKISVVVCKVFHGIKPYSNYHAAHLNGNKLDNRAANLKWCSPQENYDHRTIHGTQHDGSNGIIGALKTRGRGAPSFNKQTGNWRARTSYMRIPINLGEFKDKTHAAVAYNTAVKVIQILDKYLIKEAKHD